MLVSTTADNENSRARFAITLKGFVGADGATTREMQHVSQKQLAVFRTMFAGCNGSVSNLKYQLNCDQILTAVKLLCAEICHSIARGEWPVSVVHSSKLIVTNGLGVVLKKGFKIV